MNLKRLIALPLMVLPLCAQSVDEGNPFEVTATMTIGNADLNKMVRSNNLAGFSVGFALRNELKPGLNTRLHLALMSLRGKDKTGLENANRPHVNGGLDIMQDVNRWTFFGGLTLTQWKQNTNTATDPNFTGANATNGVKLGYRVGSEYAFTPQVRGTLSFNQAEFNKVLNPSWWALGVTYRFGK
jgi:hypothetical protein